MAAVKSISPSSSNWTLHLGLVVCNVVWSVLHILMSFPLREGASPAVLSFLRETVGFLALASLALYLDNGKRPPVSQRILSLCCLAGLMSALIRVTIICALQNAGPDVTAASALVHVSRRA